MHEICMKYASYNYNATICKNYMQTICNYMQIYANICKEYAINMQMYA